MKIDECINLKERFGQKYKVTYEESYYAERTIDSLVDPWMMILLCRNGHICPWGDSLLAACTKTNGPVANRLRKLSFVTVAQDGADGVNVLFDVKHFDKIAAIMLPRRRRTLSEEQKQKCVERLQKHRPTKGKSSFLAAAQQPETTPECDASTRGDSQAVQV